LSYPVLAMAYYARGELDLAHQALGEAAQALDRWTQSRHGSQNAHSVVHRGAVPTWPVAWWDWLECELLYAEAKQLIDGLPPADDPRLLVLAARAFAGLHWTVQADETYDEALKQWPNDRQVRFEAHRNRGNGHAEAGRWSKAAVAFARALEIAPDEAYLWRFRAVALFAAGHVDEYREVCAAMIDRFEKSSDAWTACNVVFACVLGADALTETSRLLPVAEVAAPYFHFGAYVRGAALYRAGRPAEAAQSLELAAKNYRPRAWEWCFLAMAQHRLGQTDEARRSFAKADRWIEDANRPMRDDLSGTGATWDGWSEEAAYPLLLNEAKP
jgi:tetratricopeptide (TPR) repeat protein